MKTLLVISTLLIISSALRCRPKFHFWRPYNGSIPRDAFVADIDEEGKRSFVAKIIPLGRYSRTIPVQFKEGACDHIDFSWDQNQEILRVDEFIEILCTDTPKNLSWRRVVSSPSELSSQYSQCCLVQGGLGYVDRIYRTFIGKGVEDGGTFIGRIYLENEWPGVHIMDGGKAKKIFNNFDVLTYGCEEIPIPTHTNTRENAYEDAVDDDIVDADEDEY